NFLQAGGLDELQSPGQALADVLDLVHRHIQRPGKFPGCEPLPAHARTPQRLLLDLAQAAELQVEHLLKTGRHAQFDLIEWTREGPAPVVPGQSASPYEFA